MFIDLCGQRFGALEVVCLSDRKYSSGECLWICECDCGNITHVPGYSLRHGGRTCCPECSKANQLERSRQRAEERARQAEAERAEKLRLREEAKREVAERAEKLRLQREQQRKKPVYEPKTDCRAYAGDRCAGLKEMLCKTQGECKFYKSKDTNRQDSP